MALVNIRGVFAGLLFQFPVGAADDRRFYNATIDGFTEWRVANHMFEDLAFVVLRRGAEIQLGDEADTATLAVDFMNKADCFVPGRIGVPHMVGLVIDDHHGGVFSDPLPEGGGGIERGGFRDGRPHPAIGIRLYSHGVFTLPAELISLVLANQRRLYRLLF